MSDLPVESSDVSGDIVVDSEIVVDTNPSIIQRDNIGAPTDEMINKFLEAVAVNAERRIALKPPPKIFPQMNTRANTQMNTQMNNPSLPPYIDEDDFDAISTEPNTHAEDISVGNPDDIGLNDVIAATATNLEEIKVTVEAQTVSIDSLVENVIVNSSTLETAIAELGGLKTTVNGLSRRIIRMETLLDMLCKALIRQGCAKTD